MREPHGPSRQDRAAHAVFIHCESTGSSTTASTHITKPTATTTFCQEHAYKARGPRGPPEVEGAPREP